MSNFADRLLQKIRSMHNPTVMGLDPMLDYIPPSLLQSFLRNGEDPLQAAGLAITAYNRALIDSIADVVPAVKPQLAYYEQYGVPGLTAFKETCSYAQAKGLLVIADGKRNDIGTTAAAYARSYLGTTSLMEGKETSAFYSDALTINPYLGSDGIDPFLKECKQHGKGVFILVRTSNPSAGDFQDLILADGRTVFESVADRVNDWGSDLVGVLGYSAAGAVVGATYPEQAKVLRQRMPKTLILVPGYGAQGATADDCAMNFDRQGLGAIVNASRSLMLAYKKYQLPHEAFADACRREALLMRDALNESIAKRCC